MAASIDWGTKVITIQQSDTSLLTLVSGTVYRLDTNALRLQLKDLEDDSDGMPWPKTHTHNTEVTISGTTYVRFIEILAPYTITFLPDTQWTVIMDGASNNNFHDVAAGILNQNQVQVIPSNSAGNTVTETGVSGLTAQEAADLAQAAADAAQSAADALLARKLIDADRVLVDGAAGNMQWIDADDGVTVLRTKSVKNKAGGAIVMPDDAPAEERKD